MTGSSRTPRWWIVGGALGNLIGITGPVIAGRVIDVTGAPRVAFLLIAGLLAAAAMVMLRLRENSDGQAAAHAASFPGA